ncbi:MULTISPECIES: phosphate acyltransferase PlsX [Sedimentibacter]|jgi:glycerol-3-phosphate acyltransferase PlsX|uniref:Phosphate acyltransferase n=1 Tax=Sedimentibacter saalensis TaxID=130788 RepID=A0A562JH32_9FIRM|nr:MULTISPECIES: phosphate acyltransferase PlsX [Sedimentibacter]MEA5094440.1 phosphate acyltransferase PlsX [Sedimentibacter saalensis]TWH82499.1 phosphate:acyl-[acyl carrier protein] acyltransferase [Sedimentibacter saalensis]
MKVAVDAMGGDNAPEAIVKGSILARDEYNLSVILSGKEKEVKQLLEKYTSSFNKIEIINAEEVITNDDKPVMAIRRKKDSSLVVACNAVKNKEADAVVSAGSTGALLSGGTLIVGRIEGIQRPAIGSLIPNMSGGFALLIDSGANVDSKPEFLYDFAMMGDIYLKKVMNVENPRIALANIGAEKSKGDKLTVETYELLENTKLPMNFIGNIEAREILQGKADIIVCDGFVGNMILKTLEGTVLELMKGLKNELMSSTRTKIGAALIKPALMNFKNKFDYSEHGGAPLLGVKAPVIKAHGSSDEKAIKNAIRQAKMCCESNVNELIEESITRR